MLSLNSLCIRVDRVLYINLMKVSQTFKREIYLKKIKSIKEANFNDIIRSY